MGWFVKTNCGGLFQKECGRPGRSTN